MNNLEERIIAASDLWKRGATIEVVARSAGLTLAALRDHISVGPEMFPPRQDNPTPPPASYDPERGRMPPKAPGTYGVPAAMMLPRMCRFPLWGDAEQPTQLSLYCGEPVEGDGCYCRFHAKLAEDLTSDERAAEMAEC